ncbi:MAG: sulfatase-like hydrolase/transferase [Verrucomicrobiota bacterium]
MKSLIGTLAVLSLVAQVGAASKPNIILVMADDQGWGDMAYNGHPMLKTPNFDEAAAAGLRFDRFYAAAPVCSPTRASVMTGRHPNRMGVFKWGYPMRPQEITLAEALKTAGYRTGHFGKWHLGSVRKKSPANPGRNGFDVWFSAPNFYDNDAIMSDRGKAVQTRGESSMIAMDAALNWMEGERKTADPFLAVVWFGSPHVPHVAAEEDRKLYDDQPKKDQHFLGEITGMDRAYGKLRKALEDWGIRENTMLWYCSDNGALPRVGSTGGFRGNKGKVYEGGLLVPSILEWPARLKTPRVTSMRCNTSDMYPTLLDVAGVTMKDQPPLDGISLLPLIDGRDETRPEPMGFWDFKAGGIKTPSAQWMGALLKAQEAGGDLDPHSSSVKAAELPNPKHDVGNYQGHAAWIDGALKLHRMQTRDLVSWQLYHLKDDPKEEHNVMTSGHPSLPGMMEAMEAWLKSVVGSLNGDDY